MRRPTAGTAGVRLALFALLSCAAARSEAQAPESPMPAAGPAAPVACGALAARYEDGRGFGLLVTRAGEVRVENPLRPLTPEVNHLLQVVIAGKVATAYGSNFAALRRGGAPGAVEAMLGGSIRWQAALPVLPDPLAIVAEDGAPLARLSFRACEDAPAVKAAPQARKKAPANPSKDAARKTPPGFSMPQGAIAE